MHRPRRRRLAPSARDGDGGLFGFHLRSPTLPIPPRGSSASRLQTGTTFGFEGFEGGERCAHVVCAEPMWLKCLCRDQLPIYAWPAVPLGNKLSARLARAIRQRATIISLTAWAAGALEQPMQHQPDRPTAGQFQCGSAAVSSPSSRSASSWPACRAVDSGRSSRERGLFRASRLVHRDLRRAKARVSDSDTGCIGGTNQMDTQGF
jgi:hypothetical protein